jgi:hypothetical protein
MSASTATYAAVASDDADGASVAVGRDDTVAGKSQLEQRSDAETTLLVAFGSDPPVRVTVRDASSVERVHAAVRTTLGLAADEEIIVQLLVPEFEEYVLLNAESFPEMPTKARLRVERKADDDANAVQPVEADDEESPSAASAPEEQAALLTAAETTSEDAEPDKQTAAGQRLSCCKRCNLRLKRCTFWLQNRRVRGFRLPALVGVLASLVLPEMDAASDWLVTYQFYEDGDTHWFHASLTILLVSGCVATLGLAMTFGIQGTRCCTNLSSKSCGLPTCCGDICSCGNLALALLAALIAVPGLAPVATAGLMLYMGEDADRALKDGFQMKGLKAAELVLEALPQSILQAYVAVSYGRLNPSDQEHFSSLLCFSISISLLGAGSTNFMAEATCRNQHDSALQMKVGSRYGITTVLLRACQTGMLVFWIALMACAEKGLAIIAVVASLVVYIGMGFEATFGRTGEHFGKCECGPNGFTMCLPTCCGLLNKKPVLTAFVSNTLPLLIAGGIASTFWTIEHVDNNYANRTAPIGPPGSPQHFDCRERTSGIYPAVFFGAMSLVLMPLSLAMDPVLGVRCLRGKSVQEKWEEQYEKDRKQVLREVLKKRGQEQLSQELLELLEEDGSTSQEPQIHALWQWADEAQQGSLGKKELERLAGERSLPVVQVFQQLKVCTTDGKPASEFAPSVEWDNAKHGKGTAVMQKSDGRCGVSIMDIVDGDNIKIKYDDDGSVSDWIKTDKVQAIYWQALEAALEAGMFDGATLSEADFRTACREGNFVEAWRKKLELPDTTGTTIDQAFEAAVRQRKVDAVWRWADTVEDGTLQKEELERLADGLGGRCDFKYACERLGVPAADMDDVAVTKAEFAAATIPSNIDHRHRGYEGQLFAEFCFDKLRLPLLRVEAGCLDFFCAC